MLEFFFILRIICDFFLNLVALIQMMAAAEAKRDLCYFTFDDADLRDDLHKMHQFIKEKQLSVS